MRLSRLNYFLNTYDDVQKGSVLKKYQKKETMGEYIDRYKAKYKTLNPVFSPCLKTTVHFTAEGFNHLIFKSRHKRPTKVIKSRLPLINLAIPVLRRCKSVSKTLILEEMYKGRKINVMYFELSCVVGKKCPAKIKVIVKKRGNEGNLFFLSIMKQKTPKK